MRSYRVWIVLGILLCGALCFCAESQAQARSGQSGATGQSRKAGLRGDAMIQYDEETGSLIVITDEDTNKEIGRVVKSLDRPAPQVLIKVLFLEVTHTNDLDLGFEGTWTKKTKHNFSTQVDTQTVQDLFGVANQTTGGFYRILTQDLNMTLRALSEVTKFEVLSRPSILTRNNKQATINVGQKIPIITGSTVSALGGINNSIQYVDFGIILDVTPHISEDGLVAMDVAPQITALTDQTVPVGNNIEAPVFSTRSATTSVVVPDGLTVVIGGLMEDNNTSNNKKLPLLGDIPLLGAAFRNKSDSKSKTELLIFLTPHVVTSADELTAMTVAEKDKAALPQKAFKEEEVNRFVDLPKGAPATPTEGLQSSEPEAQKAPDATETPQPAPDAQAAPADMNAGHSPEKVTLVPQSKARKGGNRGMMSKPRR